jgi:manganese/iron transport system substrate-binding protein
VQSIVPIGASPETYQPTPQDIATLSNAQLLVENGAGLETWLQKMLSNVGSSTMHTVDCAKGLPIKGLNPHLWMDPVLAQQYVLKIRDGLIAVDPTHASQYMANAANYNLHLALLTKEIQLQVNTIPRSQRYMIVFHNAWQYYNDRFGITTLGIVEMNPGQEPNPQQIAALIDLAKSHGVRAVFSEPEYSPKILQSIAQGAGVKVVEDLYDDSIGTEPRVANYVAMLHYDTDVIVSALK